MHLTHPKYRADIDGLRAIAILSVVGFHAFPKRIASGFIGVDIFFVISGFLISSIIFSSLERDRFSLVEFYSRRIKRIFPALLLVMVASLAFGGFALYSDEYMQLGKHIAGGAGFVSNFMLWGESGYFDNAAKAKPLLHLWSLAIEEQFYIFWPLLLALAWKHQWNFLKVTILIAVASFAAEIYLSNNNLTEAFYSPLPRFWELMIGGVLAFIVLHKPQINSRHKNLQSISGAILLAIGFALINKSRAFPGWWVLLPTFGTALIISAGAGAWLNRKILSNKVLVWFGLISYPLYLWHWPLLSFGMTVASADGPSPGIRNPAILISILLAWLTYQFIEQPVRTGRHGRMKTMVLLATMIVVGSSGYMIYQQDGLRFRSASTITDSYSYDFRFPPVSRIQCSYPRESHDGNWDWCTYGNTERDPSVALLGDSFAGSFSQTLLYASKYFPFTFKQFGRGLCPPLLNYGPAVCAEAYKYYYDWVKDTPSVKVVVLAAAWPNYASGMDYNFATPPQAFSSSEFQKSFIQSMEFLIATNKKIVISLAPPGGVNPRACLPRPFKIISRFQQSLKDALEDDRGSRDILKKLLLQFPQVGIYDPYSYLCDEKACKIAENRKIFYIDGAHMSAQGGEYLAEKSHAALEALLFNQTLPK
jgi:peptidoglycan/LPS O-acetylase OafA/YrhL